MAKESSFDVVSKVELQEVVNAINQANKEISQRYDFKNSKSEITFENQEIKVISDDEYKLNSVIDIIKSKLIKRKVSIKNLDYGKIEQASGGLVRQIIKIKQGIENDVAKKIVKDIKSLKLKVQAQINGDLIRVSGKSKDDLQKIIQFLKDQDYGLELQFTNYR
ncbi:YajQ family cyclic di-GMP-binding protein [Vulcanibacillus modesticaldus]|uniref:Nucleotide-binding protein BHF71_06055 n=1 Tax=Vulcanibacillus modesticaldus TaxID=337097 RepID=A0A1D2YWT4_9BACI|nr:YajQ family cyclic di-GMP-binding protein [Vulcanibacillus modesticaldus]OEG00164.1 YajQ family cyclic di-GMP-binding protein [Vulcanibacillus modesticaldus]